MAMLTLSAPVRLSAAAVAQALASDWPGLQAGEASDQDEPVLSLRLDDADLAIAVMPAPLPWSDLDEPCQTSVLWPQAASALRSHAMHLIAVVTGEAAPLTLAQRLTQVIASLIARCPEVSGVYWTAAGLVLPPALFSDFAVQVAPHMPPVPLWVHFRIGQTAEGLSCGYTRGLGALGLMEIEVQAAPEPVAELRQRLQDLAEYLLVHGLVIQHGDTVGADAQEQIRVEHGTSVFGAEAPVLQLLFEPAA